MQPFKNILTHCQKKKKRNNLAMEASWSSRRRGSKVKCQLLLAFCNATLKIFFKPFFIAFNAFYCLISFFFFSLKGRSFEAFDLYRSFFFIPHL